VITNVFFDYNFISREYYLVIVLDIYGTDLSEVNISLDILDLSGKSFDVVQQDDTYIRLEYYEYLYDGEYSNWEEFCELWAGINTINLNGSPTAWTVEIF